MDFIRGTSRCLRSRESKEVCCAPDTETGKTNGLKSQSKTYIIHYCGPKASWG